MCFEDCCKSACVRMLGRWSSLRTLREGESRGQVAECSPPGPDPRRKPTALRKGSEQTSSSLALSSLLAPPAHIPSLCVPSFLPWPLISDRNFIGL